MSEKGFRVEIPVHIKRDQRARRVLAKGQVPQANRSVSRVARLLALAHKWEGMVRRGEVSCGEIARRHGLSSARVSQICGLVLLCPELQESILEERKVPTRKLLQVLAGNPTWSEHQYPQVAPR